MNSFFIFQDSYLELQFLITFNFHVKQSDSQKHSRINFHCIFLQIKIPAENQSDFRQNQKTVVFKS